MKVYSPKNFLEYSKEDVLERLESLEDAVENVAAIISLLDPFLQKEQSPTVKKTLKEAIRERIESIEESTGYDTFVEAFQIKWIQDGNSQRPPFAEIINFIRPDVWPSTNWPIGKQYLYSEDVESFYEQLTPEAAQRIVNIKDNPEKIDAEIVFDITSEITIDQLLNPSKSPRAHEYLKMFLFVAIEELNPLYTKYIEEDH